MTNEERLRIRAELARRMGITESQWRHRCEVEGHSNDEQVWCYDCCEAVRKSPKVPPDYFNSPTASRELVAWLAKQEVVVKRRFIASLHSGLSDACVFANVPIDEDMILEAMTAPPSVIARAACKALRIGVE
jgi:hypothetical protein